MEMILPGNINNYDRSDIYGNGVINGVRHTPFASSLSSSLSLPLCRSFAKPIAKFATAIAELWEEGNNDPKIYDIAQNVAG